MSAVALSAGAAQADSTAPAARCPNPHGHYPPGKCKAAVGSSTVAPGSRMTFSTTPDFLPGEVVTATVYSAGEVVAHVVASATGVATGSFLVDSTLAAGRHTLVLTGARSGTVDEVPFIVTAATSVLGEVVGRAPGAAAGGGGTAVLGLALQHGTGAVAATSAHLGSALPFTGAQVIPLALLGGAGIAAGGALLAAGRRRPSAG